MNYVWITNFYQPLCFSLTLLLTHETVINISDIMLNTPQTLFMMAYDEV